MRHFAHLLAFMIACLVAGFVIGQSMYAEGQVRLFELMP